MSITVKLRKVLGDFIDCMIVGTALSQAQGLLTEDGSIHELKRNATFKEPSL
ncbi:MAG: hypothetical protein JRN15_12025 [Nitrososphaerota archaeon]|nr:hypothetical protein [Nitrososphaerota archaeon]